MKTLLTALLKTENGKRKMENGKTEGEVASFARNGA